MTIPTTPSATTPATTTATVITTAPSTSTYTCKSDHPISLRLGMTLRIWIHSVATAKGDSVSDVIRQALSLGLPWAKEPTLYRRMRSIMKTLEKISSEASERKKEVTHLHRLMSTIYKVPNSPIETQIQINNMLTLTEHIAQRLLKVLNELNETRAQLTAFQHLTHDDCHEICEHLDKVATASSSNDRRDRINRFTQLFRSLGGV